MLTVTEGLVLREVQYKESDKMLTLLTREFGKISASCPGVRARQSATRAGTQLLSYSSITLYASRGRYSVNAAESIDLFMGLRSDLPLLSLGSYFAEVLEAVSDEDPGCGEILNLGLNCLYALAHRKKPRALIKAAFELRAMQLAGYSPDLSSCSVCSAPDCSEPRFNLKTGQLVCTSCGESPANTVPLSAEALLGAKYILLAEPRKILSFSIGQEAIELLARATERYLLLQLDRTFPTLNFYQSL